MTVLNNDTVVPPGTIARLAQTARTGAAVSPEVRYLAEPDRVWFGGGTVDPRTNLARHLTDEELAAVDRVAHDTALRQTDVLAGCCVTATVATWRRVGLFDEAAGTSSIFRTRSGVCAPARQGFPSSSTGTPSSATVSPPPSSASSSTSGSTTTRGTDSSSDGAGAVARSSRRVASSDTTSCRPSARPCGGASAGRV